MMMGIWIGFQEPHPSFWGMTKSIFEMELRHVTPDREFVEP
jgi:hypothetical protein